MRHEFFGYTLQGWAFTGVPMVVRGRPFLSRNGGVLLQLFSSWPFCTQPDAVIIGMRGPEEKRYMYSMRNDKIRGKERK